MASPWLLAAMASIQTSTAAAQLWILTPDARAHLSMSLQCAAAHAELSFHGSFNRLMHLLLIALWQPSLDKQGHIRSGAAQLPACSCTAEQQALVHESGGCDMMAGYEDPSFMCSHS